MSSRGAGCGRLLVQGVAAPQFGGRLPAAKVAVAVYLSKGGQRANKGFDRFVTRYKAWHLHSNEIERKIRSGRRYRQ